MKSTKKKKKKKKNRNLIGKRSNGNPPLHHNFLLLSLQFSLNILEDSVPVLYAPLLFLEFCAKQSQHPREVRSNGNPLLNYRIFCPSLVLPDELEARFPIICPG